MDENTPASKDAKVELLKDERKVRITFPSLVFHLGIPEYDGSSDEEREMIVRDCEIVLGLTIGYSQAMSLVKLFLRGIEPVA